MCSRWMSRRGFLRTSATAGTVWAGIKPAVRAEEADKPAQALPRRRLGRTGVDVTLIAQGMAGRIDRRLLDVSYANGTRYFDTAASYQGGKSEEQAGEWFRRTDKRREIFLVTKVHPKTPDQFVQMIDARLENMGIDYVDLFFLHGVCGGFGSSRSEEREWPALKDWAAAADKLRASGKVKAVGFSTHAEIGLRTELLQNAVKGGWGDAIMVAADPSLIRENDAFNRALDACHKADIGLICMKEMRAVEQMPKLVPGFEKRGLTSHQAVLTAVWSDERFSCICSNMTNVKMIEENTAAAKRFTPFTEKELGMVHQLYKRYAANFCSGCDGRCKTAAGTKAELGDIARYLCYFEQDGARAEARQLFRSLPPEARDWGGADLKAASKACVSHLDFAAILQRVGQELA